MLDLGRASSEWLRRVISVVYLSKLYCFLSCYSFTSFFILSPLISDTLLSSLIRTRLFSFFDSFREVVRDSLRLDSFTLRFISDRTKALAFWLCLCFASSCSLSQWADSIVLAAVDYLLVSLPEAVGVVKSFLVAPLEVSVVLFNALFEYSRGLSAERI